MSGDGVELLTASQGDREEDLILYLAKGEWPSEFLHNGLRHNGWRL